MLEIASTLKLDFPISPLAQREHFLVTGPMNNLGEVLQKFLVAQKLLGSLEVLERLAFEACEDAFNDGVRILELRYAPTFIVSANAAMSFQDIHQALLKGVQKAEARWPMAVGLICILQRTLPLPSIEAVTRFAIENVDSFLALDLADNENGFEPAKFEKLFSAAREAGLQVTVHSGETPSPHAGLWMKESIEILGATRIGHGVQAIHHPDIVDLLIEKNVALEICPFSNYLTQAFKELGDNPLKELKLRGVPVTINSDDPGLFASLLSDDYVIAQNVLGFNPQDFADCNQTAFEHSFILLAKKHKVWGP